MSDGIASDVIVSDVIVSDVIVSDVIVSDVIVSDVIMSDVIVSDVIVSDVIGSDIIVSDGVFCRPKDPGIEIEDISSWGLATNSWQVLMMAQHQIKKPSLPKIKDHTHNYLFTDEDDTSRM